MTELQAKIQELVRVTVADSLQKMTTQNTEIKEAFKEVILIPETSYYSTDTKALIEQKEKSAVLIYENIPSSELIKNNVFCLHNTHERVKGMQALEAAETVWLVSPRIQLLNDLISLQDDKNLLVSIMINAILDGRNAGLAITHKMTRSSLIRDKYEALLQKAVQLGFDVEYPGQQAEKKITASIKDLLLEKDVERAKQMGQNTLTVAPKCIITPLANDRARELGINIFCTR